jgi:hypothetical protein
MAYRLTSAQRCIMADCCRNALLGWLLTDAEISQKVRRIEYKSTTISGFSFSRFLDMASSEIGDDYRPHSVNRSVRFPLSIREVAALANDIELQLATDDELWAAGAIVAHSPYGAPEVCSRDWRAYVGALAALGLSIDDDRPDWREQVRTRLHGFRRDVAAAAVADLVAAE